MNENRLPTHRPVTIRDVRPMSIYDVMPASAHAGIDKAKARCRDEPHQPEDGRRRRSGS